MKILLANPRGFCAGVYMAIDVVDQLLDICGGEANSEANLGTSPQKIYVYHEIVHNRHVVQRFRDRGAVFVDDDPISRVAHGHLAESGVEHLAREWLSHEPPHNHRHYEVAPKLLAAVNRQLGRNRLQEQSISRSPKLLWRSGSHSLHHDASRNYIGQSISSPRPPQDTIAVTETEAK